jgi:hypothetical protein
LRGSLLHSSEALGVARDTEAACRDSIALWIGTECWEPRQGQLRRDKCTMAIQFDKVIEEMCNLYIGNSRGAGSR